ncbi:MAG: zinc ribbon domain-containing protein [Christensenellales bacterium]
MFFIGIFGVGQKQKHIKDFTNIVCPHCSRLATAELLECFSYFHLFFIPVFKWNRRCLIRLRCCGAVYEAGMEYGRALKGHEIIDFSKLKKVDGGSEGYRSAFYTACTNCGKAFDGAFQYCPYCGTKK